MIICSSTFSLNFSLHSLLFTFVCLDFPLARSLSLSYKWSPVWLERVRISEHIWSCLDTWPSMAPFLLFKILPPCRVFETVQLFLQTYSLSNQWWLHPVCILTLRRHLFENATTWFEKWVPEKGVLRNDWSRRLLVPIWFISHRWDLIIALFNTVIS